MQIRFLIFLLFFNQISVAQNKIKPNIIIILADDQGWGDLRINGNLSANTPNIDKLGKTGVRFDRFFVSPVCSPTRAELLTGRYHFRSGVSGTSTGTERLNLDETTMAEIFKKAGYKTAAYGKWHNGSQAPYHPNSRGFDDFYGFCSGHWGNYFNPKLEHNGKLVKGKGFLADDIANHGIDFLQKNMNKPFLLYLPFNTPHSPMQVPDKYWNKYRNKSITQKGTLAEKENIEHTRAALAMNENLDWNIGRILNKVASLNLSENTLIIYFSDNGPNGNRWNGEMKGIKASTDEGGIRSPLIMNWKGKILEGKSIPYITCAADILPTLLDIMKLKNNISKPLDGKSMKSLIFDQNANWEDRIIPTYWAKKLSIRNQKYRLSFDNQLFDMENDPRQTKDISMDNTLVMNNLMKKKLELENIIKTSLPKVDERPFIIGFPSQTNSILAAADALSSGKIKRSSIHPNDSYFTNWIDTRDKISWKVEVAKDGDFEAIVYYSCKKLGPTIGLRFMEKSIESKIFIAHIPPNKGMENDRVERDESYVKDFMPLKLGKIHLSKGAGLLELTAFGLENENNIEVNMVSLRRLK